MPTDEMVNQPVVENLETQFNEILLIFPTIQEIYFSLQRLGDIEAKFWIGEADFKKFIGLTNDGNASVDIKNAEIRLKEQVGSDIKKAFLKYNSKFNKLKKAYQDRANRSLTVLSVSFTPFEISKRCTDLDSRISHTLLNFNKIDVRNLEKLKSFHEEVKSIIDGYDSLTTSMWSKVNEFDKFHQDGTRYWAAVIGIIKIFSGVLVAVAGFLIAHKLK